MSVVVLPCEVARVEKGNVGKVAQADTVVAFAVKQTGSNKFIKALLKGELAYQVYHRFLAELMTQPKVVTADGVSIIKIPFAGFVGDLREERNTETVYHNIKEVNFTFQYKVVDNGSTGSQA